MNAMKKMMVLVVAVVVTASALPADAVVVLVSDGSVGKVEQFALDGTPEGTFASGISEPRHIGFGRVRRQSGVTVQGQAV